MVTEKEIIDRVDQRHKFETAIGDGPAPHKISLDEYGHHASYVRHGKRIWGFVDKEGRDKFARDYQNHCVKLA